MSQFSTISISIPSIYYKSDDFIQLLQIWDELNQLSEESLDITFNFNQCKFLGHNGVAFLGGLAHLIQARQGKFTFQWDTLEPRIFANLAQNGFLHHFDHNQTP